MQVEMVKRNFTLEVNRLGEAASHLAFREEKYRAEGRKGRLRAGKYREVVLGVRGGDQ